MTEQVPIPLYRAASISFNAKRREKMLAWTLEIIQFILILERGVETCLVFCHFIFILGQCVLEK